MSSKGDMAGFLEFLAEIQREYPNILVEYQDAIWYIEDGEVWWNTEDNLQDLTEGVGQSYSARITEGRTTIGNYVIMNADTMTGTWVTSIFPLIKNVSLEDLENA